MLEFIAYSDIHHDDYKNGVTLQDAIDVENAITSYAVTNGIKNIFFLGDWYRATNPLQKVIKEAENTWKVRSDSGIITHVLPGNHDRYTKSPNSEHAFAAVNIFSSDWKNILVYETVKKNLDS